MVESVRAVESMRATSSPTSSAMRCEAVRSMVTLYSANLAETNAARSCALEPTFVSTTSPAAFTSLFALVPTTPRIRVTAGAGLSIQAMSSATSSVKSDCASRTTTTRLSTRNGGVLSASITLDRIESELLDAASFAVKS